MCTWSSIGYGSESTKNEPLLRNNKVWFMWATEASSSFSHWWETITPPLPSNDVIDDTTSVYVWVGNPMNLWNCGLMSSTHHGKSEAVQLSCIALSRWSWNSSYGAEIAGRQPSRWSLLLPIVISQQSP